MLQNEYEIVIIIRPDIDDGVTNEIVERVEATITDGAGNVLIRDDWGKRKLAYPIQKHLKGHYVLINFTAPAELVTEVERRIRINDNVIRFLTVKKVDAVDVSLRIEQAAEQRRLRDEERARQAAMASDDEDDDSDDDTDDRDDRRASA